MSTRSEYKQEEFVEMPQDWGVATIDDISKVRRGASPRPISDPSYFADKGRGWVRIVDVTSTYKYLRKTSQYLSMKGEERSVKVDPGGLIMSICATIGKPVIVNIPACIHDGFVWFSQLSSRVDSEFLFYVLQSMERQFVSKRQIGTQGNLNTTIVGRTPVPIPPIQEQRQIVAVLATIDDAIDKTNDIIAKTQQLKKSLMKHLLTEGIGHTKFKQTEIGQIPEEWEVTAISSIAQVRNGSTPRRNVKEYWENGTIPWIPTAQVNETYIDEPLERITEKALHETSLSMIPKGSILLAMTGQGLTRGKVAKLRIDATINQNFAAIFPSDKLDMGFLFHYLDFNYQRIRNLGRGGNQWALNCEIVRNIRVPIPPEEEQREIACILSSTNRKSEEENQRRAKLIRLKRGLMQDLLAGKVRVKVN